MSDTYIALEKELANLFKRFHKLALSEAIKAGLRRKKELQNKQPKS